MTEPDPPLAPVLELHLGHRATELPDRPAVIMTGSGEVTTYRMLDERSNRLAHALRAAGLQTGDHLALMMENSSALLEVTWAAQRAGLYYTALNSHLRRSEVQHILDDCGAVAFVVSARLGEVAGVLDLDRIRLRVVVGGELAGFEPYDRVLGRGLPTPVDDEAEGREMLYSSGTTGVPKGVRKTLTPGPPGDPGSASVQIAMAIGARGIGADTVYLSPAPLYHSAPLVYCMVTHRLGGTCVVMESFDAAGCLAAIERYRVTHAQFVPTMFTRMLRLPEEERLAHDLSSLTWVVHAAAPCPVPVKQQMMAWWGPIIHEYYAGTEDIGASQITPEEWLAHPGSVGRPLGEVHIVGPDGEEVPVGRLGHRLLRRRAGVRVPQRSRQDGPDAQRQGLANPGRRRPRRRRGLPLPDRPGLGHGGLRRGQHLPPRGRAGPGRPPPGGRRGRVRCA